MPTINCGNNKCEMRNLTKVYAQAEAINKYKYIVLNMDVLSKYLPLITITAASSSSHETQLLFAIWSSGMATSGTTTGNAVSLVLILVLVLVLDLNV